MRTIKRVELTVDELGELPRRQGAIARRGAHHDTGKLRHEHIEDAPYVLVRERGDQKYGPRFALRLGLANRIDEILAALRIVACIDQYERLNADHVETTRYGAGLERDGERGRIERAAQIPLRQRYGTGGVLRLVSGLVH